MQNKLNHGILYNTAGNIHITGAALTGTQGNLKSKHESNRIQNP